MRFAPAMLTGLLFCAAPAGAQVTTNDGALDALVPARPARPAPQRPARPTHPAHATPAHSAPAATPPTGQPGANRGAHPDAKTAKPAIPVTPPAILAIPPAVAVPMMHPPPPPPVPIAEDAPGGAAPLQDGVRITFGAGRADFAPATAEALARFASTVADKDAAVVTIFAYAPGSPDDPSTPRRLSFERALAIRAGLMKAGIASARIYPRALGPAGGDMPDRADVVVGSGPPPAVGPAG